MPCCCDGEHAIPYADVEKLKLSAFETIPASISLRDWPELASPKHQRLPQARKVIVVIGLGTVQTAGSLALVAAMI